jgi:glycosyltransferase involved in cell wall biosynthesis
MKIAFINDTFLVGRGVDTVIYELARRIGKKHDITIICSKGFCNIKEEKFKIDQIDMGKLFTGSMKDLLLPLKLLKLRRYLRKKKFDIINLHHSTLFLGLIGIKNIIVTYYGFPPAYGLTKYPRIFINLIGRITLKFARKVITISQYLKKELTRFGIQKKKIVIIPCGISEEFKPTWKDRNYMLFVGRLEKHKRVELLIKLAKEVNFPLKIVGDGPERKKLINLTKNMKAPVSFLGIVDRKKLVKLYQECSFFVSASIWEGFGLIFLEANSCGKPVIGYDCTAISERIKNGCNGFKVKNLKELIISTKKLINDKNLRKKMGKIAYEISKNLNWKRVSDKYEKIYM